MSLPHFGGGTGEAFRKVTSGSLGGLEAEGEKRQLLRPLGKEQQEVSSWLQPAEEWLEGLQGLVGPGEGLRMYFQGYGGQRESIF